MEDSKTTKILADVLARAAAESENVRMLPKTAKGMPGSLHADYRRCGRPNCRCARGKLHGPYFRRHWWEDGRQHWAYVKPSDLVATREALATWKRCHPPVRSTRRVLTHIRTIARRMGLWPS